MMQWEVHSNLRQRQERERESRKKVWGKKGNSQYKSSHTIQVKWNWQQRGNSNESIKLLGESVQLSQAPASGYYQDVWIICFLKRQACKRDEPRLPPRWRQRAWCAKAGAWHRERRRHKTLPFEWQGSFNCSAWQHLPRLPQSWVWYERSRDAFICDTAELKWLFIENLRAENNVSVCYAEVSPSLLRVKDKEWW